MTPPKVPEGRPYTPEELHHTLYADAYTAAENLFRVLRESHVGNHEISLFTFDATLANLQMPTTIANAMPHAPSTVVVNFMEENGQRPDLRLALDYGDMRLSLGRLGTQDPSDPFSLTVQQGNSRNANYAPIPAAEVNQLLTSLAMKEEFLVTFGTARLKTLDVQDSKHAEVFKAGLYERASKVEHVSDYQLDLHDKDGYWLRARQNTVSNPPSYTLALSQTESDLQYMQSRQTAIEVTLEETTPDSSLARHYAYRVEYHIADAVAGPAYASKQEKPLSDAVLSSLIAACTIGATSLRGSVPDVMAYERYAQLQMRKDNSPE